MFGWVLLIPLQWIVACVWPQGWNEAATKCVGLIRQWWRKYTRAKANMQRGDMVLVYKWFWPLEIETNSRLAFSQIQISLHLFFLPTNSFQISRWGVLQGFIRMQPPPSKQLLWALVLQYLRWFWKGRTLLVIWDFLYLWEPLEVLTRSEMQIPPSC